MRHERGWIGMLAILIALVIIAFLAQTALKRYGLLPVEQTRSASGKDPSGAAADAAASGASSATSSFRAPIERAKGVEGTVLQGAGERNKQLEEQSR